MNISETKIPKQLGAIPVKPEIFLGRDKSTQDIHQHLSQNNAMLLLVNGEGGIGKTTIASQYYYEYSHFYQYRIWLASEKGIQDAILSLALSLGLRFGNGMTYEAQLNEVIRYILQLNKPILLVIDNANSYKDLENSFTTLQQLHNIHILLTSRVNNCTSIPVYKVKPLSEEDAIQLFKNHYPLFKTKEEGFLKHILKMIGYNTLITEVLAKSLAKFNDKLAKYYPLQRLLEYVQSKIKTDDKPTKAKPKDIITAMTQIATLTDTQIAILSVFWVLPPIAIPFADLQILMGNIDKLHTKLKQLVAKGWIDYDRQATSFKMNPAITEDIIRKKNEILTQDLEYLVNMLVDRLTYDPATGNINGDFEDTLRFVAYAEHVAVIYQQYWVAYNYYPIFERIGNFFKNYGNLDKALAYFQDDLKLIKGLCESYPKDVGFKNTLAIAYSKLGETHTALGNLDKALAYFQDETVLFEELYESNPNNVEVKNGLAASYLTLGDTYTALGHLDKALAYFQDDIVLFQELYESNPNNVGFKRGLAITYKKLGSTHSALGNLDKALAYFQDDLKLTKELYESNPNNVGFKSGLAISHIKLGVFLIKTDSKDKKEKGIAYLKTAKLLFKELKDNYPAYKEFADNYRKLAEVV